MIFQKVLKGIAGITQAHARGMLDGDGIICNWWRNSGGVLNTSQIPDELTEANLLLHLSAYHKPAPGKTPSFGHLTPFISTTAGGVERDDANALNLRFSAFLTALGFATNNYKTHGVIFYGYVNVLGRKAVPMQEFAEETRELNIWNQFQPYHRQGEIAAKIVIPPAHLERAVGYDGPAILRAARKSALPTPMWTEWNTNRYVPPESICNVRDVIL